MSGDAAVGIEDHPVIGLVPLGRTHCVTALVGVASPGSSEPAPGFSVAQERFAHLKVGHACLR